MRLAVSRKATKKLSCRRNSRWPKKKNVNSKKKVLAAKAKVSGFLVKTCFGTEKCYICSKSFAFSLCQQSYYELLFILVPRARDPSGLHQGSRTQISEH